MEEIGKQNAGPKCYLSNYNTDFELIVPNSRLSVKTRDDSGFEWLWKSCKTNYGIHGGKYMFECKITNFIKVNEPKGEGFLAKKDFSEKTLDQLCQRHQVRLGWSTFSAKSNLGSDFEGIGFDNNGIKYYGGIQKSFGTGFMVGDVIRCCIDLQDTYTVSYFKNGTFLGTAYKIPDRYQYKNFFPHVCLRNAEIELNFGWGKELFPIISKIETDIDENKISLNVENNGNDLFQNNLEQLQKMTNENLGQEEKELTKPQNLNDNLLDLRKYQVNLEEYLFLEKANEKDIEYENFSPQQCEQKLLIMMIGLPCCGKTTYALKYMQKNYEKNFILLSSFEIFDHIINTLIIPKLKSNLILLMEISNEIFKKTLEIACQTNKNFIIDQTNLFLNTRLEKLNLFEKFSKEAVVIVLSEEEQKNRIQSKEKFLIKNNLNYPKLCQESYRNMQENFCLPDGENFEKITYPELDQENSHKMVCLLNKISEKQIHPLLREKEFNDLKEIMKMDVNSGIKSIKTTEVSENVNTSYENLDVKSILSHNITVKAERTSSIVQQPSVLYQNNNKISKNKQNIIRNNNYQPKKNHQNSNNYNKNFNNKNFSKNNKVHNPQNNHRNQNQNFDIQQNKFNNNQNSSVPNQKYNNNFNNQTQRQLPLFNSLQTNIINPNISSPLTNYIPPNINIQRPQEFSPINQFIPNQNFNNQQKINNNQVQNSYKYPLNQQNQQSQTNFQNSKLFTVLQQTPIASPTINHINYPHQIPQNQQYSANFGKVNPLDYSKNIYPSQFIQTPANLSIKNTFPNIIPSLPQYNSVNHPFHNLNTNAGQNQSYGIGIQNTQNYPNINLNNDINYNYSSKINTNLNSSNITQIQKPPQINKNFIDKNAWKNNFSLKNETGGFDIAKTHEFY